MAKETFQADPAKTEYHANKRELLRRGKERGELTWQEINEALPAPHLGEVELAVFLFTCRQLGIEVIGQPN